MCLDKPPQANLFAPSLGLDTNCFLNFLLAFLKIFPIFPTNLPKFLKIFSKISIVIRSTKNIKNYSDTCT